MKSEWLNNEKKATAICERIETLIALLELDGKPSGANIKALRTMRWLDYRRGLAEGRAKALDNIMPTPRVSE